ncbi:MAG: Mobile element protein, partial [uncultured Acetobacteraceae bacterium]
AGGRGVRHQAAHCDPHGRARARGGRAVLLGGGRHGVRRGRGRDGVAPGGQGLRARGHGRAPRPLLGRAADRRGHGRRGCGRTPSLGVAPPLGGRGHEGAAPVRLGLSRTRPPRGGRVRRGGGGPLDARPARAAPRRRWRTRVLHDVVPERHPGRRPRGGRGAALDHRGRLREREERTRPRPQRDPLMARLAPPRLARDAGLRRARCDPPSGKRDVRANPAARESRERALVRWSLQEIRRIAARLAQRRIRPAIVLAWSAWRRAHQAAARRSHL